MRPFILFKTMSKINNNNATFLIHFKIINKMNNLSTGYKTFLIDINFQLRIQFLVMF